MFATNVWNIIDIVPLVLVSASVTCTLLPSAIQSVVYQRYLNAVASFFIWLKCYDFFRMDRSFAHLITIITTVLSDMVAFLLLLLIAVLAFAGTFYLLSNN
jgi:hypothetical protein